MGPGWREPSDTRQSGVVLGLQLLWCGAGGWEVKETKEETKR